MFPILQGKGLSTPTKEHAAIASGNTIADKYLKKIAKRTGITTDLTTHLARHSIAWHLKKSSIDDAP